VQIGARRAHGFGHDERYVYVGLQLATTKKSSRRTHARLVTTSNKQFANHPRTGKIAAQCSHATLACYKALLHSSATDPAQARLLRRWERHGQAKVALQVKSEDELEVLQAQAMSLGVCARIVQDAGRTQIASGSKTVLGVGPAPKGVVDRITGELKLL